MSLADRWYADASPADQARMDAAEAEAEWYRGRCGSVSAAARLTAAEQRRIDALIARAGADGAEAEHAAANARLAQNWHDGHGGNGRTPEDEQTTQIGWDALRDRLALLGVALAAEVGE